MDKSEGEFKKLEQKRYASVQQRETAEARFWSRFKGVKQLKYTAPATSLHFSPLGGSDLAVSTSLSVVLLDAKTQK